jgi:hypothetical protein
VGVAVFDEGAVLVVGDGLVAAHLLDVDVVAEAVDGVALGFGLGEADADLGGFVCHSGGIVQQGAVVANPGH